MAVPSTIVLFFVLIFIWDIKREELRERKTHNALIAALKAMVEKTKDDETTDDSEVDTKWRYAYMIVKIRIQVWVLSILMFI